MKKVTECWCDELGAGYPDPKVEFKFGYMVRKEEKRPAILMWKHDYNALLAELAEYKKIVKTCERCEKKEFYEFIYHGKDDREYCESCHHHMFKEWGK